MKNRKNIILMVSVLAVSLALTAVSGVCYLKTENGVSLSLFVTFLTVSYHFSMRLAVGETVTVLCRNKKFNTENFFFKERKFEPALYERLGVKHWKNKVLTAKPEQFKVSKDCLLNLVHNICQAETVHAVIAVLSFLPLFLIFPFGAPAVFILTSVFAALIDLKYVLIQRYNLPRAERLLETVRRRKHNRPNSVDYTCTAFPK